MMTESDAEEAARAMAALGHVARLEVFRLLVRAGEDGMVVGEIGRRLATPASTLAHHLRALVRADLVVQEKRGNQVLNKPNFARLDHVLRFVMEECCQDAGVELAS